MAELGHYSGMEYVQLATASLNSDMGTRGLSPVTIINNSYFYLIHSLQIYSWYIRYTYQWKLSLFITLCLWINPVRCTSQVPVFRCHIMVTIIWLCYKDLKKINKTDVSVSMSMWTPHCSIPQIKTKCPKEIV